MNAGSSPGGGKSAIKGFMIPITNPPVVEIDTEATAAYIRLSNTPVAHTEPYGSERIDDGWKPVYDCWDFGDRPGIGPGSSVATEGSSIRLVMAAACAYAARLPMYVFHSQAGVFGKTRFEDTPAIREFRHLEKILPADLPNWRRHDGKEEEAPFTVFAGGQPNRYVPDVPTSLDGCVRNIGSRKDDRFVCVPIGIRAGGLPIEAREDLEFEAIDPVTGKSVRSAQIKSGERLGLPAGPGGLIVTGRVSRTARK
jgi:hypothetical protein